MTLFELQEWLGHRSPEATRHYAKISPNVLTKAYRDAGYFEGNIRTIEVLVDRDAVTSGAAASGQPWQFYDRGHGYCTYTFFEQCPHRMACARCDFSAPKASSRGLLLEAKENLQRMAVGIPSPSTNTLPSKTGNRHSATSSPASPTSRRRAVRRPARWTPPRAGIVFRSSTPTHTGVDKQSRNWIEFERAAKAPDP
jgi:hypothetical protein